MDWKSIPGKIWEFITADFDVPLIRALWRHTSSAFFGIFFFRLGGIAITLGFHEGWVRTALENIDHIGLIMLFLILLKNLAVELWKGGSHASVFASVAA